jgi:hypothetical protein
MVTGGDSDDDDDPPARTSSIAMQVMRLNSQAIIWRLG